MARPPEKRSVASSEVDRTVTVTSTEAQNTLGDLLDRVARGDRVVVTRYNRRRAVLLSVEEYNRLLGEEEVDLSSLEREFDEQVARMQTPAHRDAVERLFRLSGEELGERATSEGEADRADP